RRAARTFGRPRGPLRRQAGSRAVAHRPRHPAALHLGAAPARVARTLGRATLPVDNRYAMTDRIPVTIVTGFLGAGKTTLVRHLLAHAKSRRIALIINE